MSRDTHRLSAFQWTRDLAALATSFSHRPRDATLPTSAAARAPADGSARADTIDREQRRARPLRWRVVLLALGVALGATLLGAYIHRARKSSQTQYITAPLTRGPVAPYVTSSGTVNPVITVQVGAYVSGTIQSLTCDFNTKVRTGQVCAKIDPRPYQTVVDQNRANLVMAKAQLVKDRADLAFTKRVYERDQRLLTRGIVSQETTDTAKDAYEQDRAEIDLDLATIAQRQALLSAAQVNLDYTDIVSPVDGTVVSRSVTQGQTVAASFQTPTLFLIATDLTQLQVDANVSESDVGDMRLGDQASFHVEAYPDQTFTGQVLQIRQAPQTVQNVVTYDVVISASNPELKLMPGMTATTRIVTKRHDDVLRVPNQALRYLPREASATRPSDQPALWIVRDGDAVRIAVKTGLQDDVYTEIVAGSLAPGSAVIVSERARGASSATAARGNAGGPRLPRL